MMGIFGGSVAFYHFPRVFPQSNTPVQLPDFGYDIIPYWCPMIHHTNTQSSILMFLYLWIFIGAACRRNSQGRLIMQQLLHMNAMLFLMRTTTVGITGLPQPDPRCIDIQSKPATYMESIKFVMLRGFPPHACGDLIFSGHVACTLACAVILHRHDYLNGIIAYAMTLLLVLLSMYSVIACRSHYTVDVILAMYFVHYVQYWYFSKVDSISWQDYAREKNISYAVKLIAWLEDKSITQDDEARTESSSDGSIHSINNKNVV